MSVKRYKKGIYVDAIQFESTESAHIQDIIDFVGLPISIDYKQDGSIELRIIRGALDVIVAKMNDYIVKHEDGKLERIPEDEFDYEEVA